MTTKVYLAVDLGAESGRVVAGIWNEAGGRFARMRRRRAGQV